MATVATRRRKNLVQEKTRATNLTPTGLLMEGDYTQNPLGSSMSVIDSMLIIGVDFHPQFQQIARVDTDTGEFQEQRLQHREEAEMFYRALAAAGQRVRVGMEASGHARWLERLLAELQFELWIGDAAQIQSKRGRKQKTDRQDAQHILKLMLKDDFPKIWVPSWENRDLRWACKMLQYEEPALIDPGATGR
jgi:hypothetical protein